MRGITSINIVRFAGTFLTSTYITTGVLCLSSAVFFEMHPLLLSVPLPLQILLAIAALTTLTIRWRSPRPPLPPGPPGHWLWGNTIPAKQ